MFFKFELGIVYAYKLQLSTTVTFTKRSFSVFTSESAIAIVRSILNGNVPACLLLAVIQCIATVRLSRGPVAKSYNLILANARGARVQSKEKDNCE